MYRLDTLKGHTPWGKLGDMVLTAFLFLHFYTFMITAVIFTNDILIIDLPTEKRLRLRKYNGFLIQRTRLSNPMRFKAL